MFLLDKIGYHGRGRCATLDDDDVAVSHQLLSRITADAGFLSPVQLVPFFSGHDVRFGHTFLQTNGAAIFTHDVTGLLQRLHASLKFRWKLSVFWNKGAFEAAGLAPDRPQIPADEQKVRLDPGTGWDISHIPYNVAPANWSGGFALSIPRGARNANAAWEFIKCASSHVGQSSWARDTYAIPTNRLSANTPELMSDPVWRTVMEVMEAFSFGMWGRWAWNTIVITLVSMAGVTFSSSMVAYAFARLRWPGREAMFKLVLATMMLPAVVTLIPRFILFANLPAYGFQGSRVWVNTFLPLTIPAFTGSAFYIFLLRQFMRTIPNERSVAARIDGASEFRIWWSIMLPLTKPALAAVASGAWQVSEGHDEIVLSLVAGSSTWQEKVYRFYCRPNCFSYEIEVAGFGQPFAKVK
jgi:ABC-type glycerol-3-phosphate transport system permease component